MKTNSFTRTGITMFVALMTLALNHALAAPKPNVDGNGIAVQGYDVVAFFTESKPVVGSPEFKADLGGATYLFKSQENRATFVASPEKFVPQFDGFCAYGVTKGAKFPIQIETWQIVDGRLFLNKNLDVKATFEKDLRGNITLADQKWPEVSKQ